MTKHQPIHAPEHDALEMAIRRALDTALDLAERHPGGRKALGEAASGLLEILEAGMPDHTPYGHTREDAAFWADTATPAELEAYCGAALRRIERATFAPAARKRIFNALWRSFSAEERKRFLERAKK